MSYRQSRDINSFAYFFWAQAIEAIVNEYEEDILEPELKPEFIAKMKKIQKQKPIKIRDFRKHYGLE